MAYQNVKTCPGNHGLTTFRTPQAGYGCDGCKLKGIPRGTTMYGCRKCNYDLCGNCYGQSCPGNHGLKKFNTPRNTYACNGCTAKNKRRQALPTNTALYGCRICNYDLCASCYGQSYQYNEQKQNKNQSTQSVVSNRKAAEICFIEKDETRNGVWELYYFGKYGKFANKALQKTYNTSWTHAAWKNLNDKVKDWNTYKQQAQKFGQAAADKAMVSALNKLVAREIVKNSVKGAVSQSGRRGAMVIVEQSSSLLAAQGANVAKTGASFASLPVTFSAMAGEMAGDAIAYHCGVQNNHLKHAFGLGGSIGAAALAGGIVGGPFGALAGAGVGAANYTVGQTIGALMNTGFGVKGPNDNWCYIEIGDVGNKKLCFGTYASSDTWYTKTYWSEYKSSNSKWVMSAGQKQKESFQLTLWDSNNKTIKHWDKVYFRDRVRVCKKSNTLHIVFCCGENNPNAGKTTLKKW